MKIIQTSWSCKESEILSSKFGWLAPEYNIMSWALSSLQLRSYYSDVTLYCDTNYARVLIDGLKLPYTNVICDLDKLNNFHPHLWAIPKISTYSKQENPFLHVDGDVFIWKAFEDRLLEGNLIAQNLESATNYYGTIMQSLEEHLPYFPVEITDERRDRNPILAYNAGILGGSNTSFFREYCSKAFQFVKKNIAYLNKINVTNFNIFFEQYLFYCMVKKQKQSIQLLFNETIGDNQYKGFGDFLQVPYKKNYLHLLGNYKKNRVTCKLMADRLRNDYPDYYYRIIQLFRKRGSYFVHDYYFFYKGNSEKELTERYLMLKLAYKNKVLEKNSKLHTELNLIDIQRLVRNNSFLNKEQLLDLTSFCQKLNNILSLKFRMISKDYLYARDISIVQYYEYLFQDTFNIYRTNISAEENIEIIETIYDWAFYFEKGTLSRIPNNNPKPIINIAIIPECDRKGFSLVPLDDLDLVILKIVKLTKTIREILKELKVFFNESELQNEQLYFEKLILGRLKIGINNKIIKVQT
jgi:hypothetical protein